MNRRLGWTGRILVVAMLAFATRWLVRPAPDDATDRGSTTDASDGGSGGLAAPGRRATRSRLDRVIAWVRRQFESLSEEARVPTMSFERAPTLGPPGTLEVSVRDADGSPIAGARVAIFGPPSVSARTPEATRADGRATFPDLPSAAGYLVRVRLLVASGRDEELDDRSIDVRARDTTNVVIERPAHRVEVMVLDASSGAPLEGARVEASVRDAGAARARDQIEGWRFVAFGDRGGAAPVATAMSDVGGTAVLDLGRATDVELRVRTLDGRIGHGGAQRGGRRDVVRILVRAPSISVGVVVDADGRACAGAHVSEASRSGDTEAASTFTTGADGRFSLALASATTMATLVIERDAFARFSARVRTDAAARVVLPGPSALELRVVEEESGHSIEGARLLLTTGAVTTEAETSADGRARVATIPGLIESLVVSATGVRSVRLARGETSPATLAPADALLAPLRTGEARAITIAVRKGAVATGRVRRADGLPAAGVAISLYDGWNPVLSAATDADGAFRFEGVVAPAAPPLRMRAWVGGASEGSALVDVPIDDAVVARGSLAIGDIILRRGAVVRARVLDPEGRPVPDAGIVGNVSGRTDADGRVVLDVAADQLGFPSTARADIHAAGFRTRELRFSTALAPGEVRDLAPIRLERAPPFLVRAIDATGHPVVGCRVAWEASSDDRSPVTTDADGRASLSGAADDDAGIEVTLANGAVFHRYGDLATGTGGQVALDLRVPPTRDLEVRVTSGGTAALPLGSVSIRREGAPTPGFLAAWERWAVISPTGTARFASVVATPVVLEIRAGGHVTQRIEVDESATAVVVVLSPFDDASARRLRDVLAELERIEAEIRAQVPNDESALAQARYRRQEALKDERTRLLAR